MITSTANRRVKWVRALQAQRKARWDERHFVVEGVRLAQEVLGAEMPTSLVFHTGHLTERDRGLVNNLARLGADVEIVSEEVMKHCSDTETPQGLMVALPFPEVTAPESLTLAVVLDKLRDPGNMGALLRTALAAGVECVFLTHGTVDPFNPKVVRAAMGAHLHLPIQYVKDEELSAHLKKLDLWVAEMRAGQAYDEIDWTQPVAVAIGNEAYGTDDELRRLAKGFVHIPMRAESESLNAATAAAIILFEINRWRERR